MASNPTQNMADLKAQIAANEKGVQELHKRVDQFGLDVLQALHAPCTRQRAAEAVRRVISRLQSGTFTLPLDNGEQIQIAIRVDSAARSLEVDFTGTSEQQPNNFNIPTAVCMTAVLYLGSMAASQCTMNNFTVGNAQYQHDETISGGLGQ